jgi:hypothetical protein
VSTLRVAAVNNAAATTGGLSIDSSGVVTGGLPSPNRNLLYNGAMQVAQRGTSTTGITATGYYTADRWQAILSGLGTWTQTVENDAPTGSGFRKSLKMLCTTSDAAPAAGDLLYMTQILEGQDVQRIAKGTSSAQQVTLSFWVKANVTGTYVAELYDVNNTRQVSAAYTVSASATWEKKTITFPADTTGVFTNDNAAALYAIFWLGAGSTYTGGTLNTVWAADTSNKRAAGQTNLAAATNNYWQITGVQLEVGPTGTGFEFKSFGQELRECQRYYQRIVAGTAYGYVSHWGTALSTVAAVMTLPMKATLRVVPTSIDHANLTTTQDNSNVIAATAIALSASSSADNPLISITVASGYTQFRPTALIGNNNANGYIGVSAEL